MSSIVSNYSYMPQYFSVSICPKGLKGQRWHGEPVCSNKNWQNIVTETNNNYIYLHCTNTVTTSVDNISDDLIILVGELYDSPGKDTVSYLLKRFQKDDYSFVSELNGSFAIIYVNKRGDKVYAVTDRVNTRRIYNGIIEGICWLSNRLDMMPTKKLQPDMAAIACILVNGTVYNNRTIFDGIRILERASIHSFSQSKKEARSYWSYQFDESKENCNEEELSKRLSQLLTKSVERRIQDKPTISLSLSAGYDSTSVLGILGCEFKYPNIDCFSYAYGETSEHSDQYIAKQMAEYLGYNHRIILSHKGDIIDAIKNNAQLGESMGNFCDEIDVWLDLAEEFSLDRSRTIFVADACFGFQKDQKIKNLEDVLNSVDIRGYTELPWLKKLLPDDINEQFECGLQQDLSEIISRCPQSSNYVSMSDFIYLDQRLANMVLPWREKFLEKCAKVRNPFIDNDVLEFWQNVPSQLRRNRRIYVKTVKSMFPDLFDFKRAVTSAYISTWRKELVSERPNVEKMILSFESKLDSVINPAIIVKLLRELSGWKHSSYSPRILPSRVAFRYLKGTSLCNYILKIFPIVDHKTILRRLLVMRFVLKK